MADRRRWSRVRENLGLRSLSLALAVVAWLFVKGERTYEVTVIAPVEYIYPQGLILLNDDPPPEQVVLKATGTRAALKQLQERLREVEVGYLVNVENVGKGPAVHSFRRPPSGIPSQVAIETVAPAEVELVFDEVMQREVEVELRTSGDLPPGYAERSRVVSPVVLDLIGARSELRSLERVQTLPLRMGDRTQTFDGILGLDLSRLHLHPKSPETVRVRIEVEERHGDLEAAGIAILAEGLPDGLRLEPSQATVQLSGPLPVLHEVAETGLQLRLDLGTEEGLRGRVPVEVSVELWPAKAAEAEPKPAEDAIQQPVVQVSIDHQRSKEVRVRWVRPEQFRLEVESESGPTEGDGSGTAASPPPDVGGQ